MLIAKLAVQDSFPDVRAVARAANQSKEGDSWPDLEKRAQRAKLSRPAVGISAADNYGADTVLFVKLWRGLALGKEDFLDILLQSKYTRGETMRPRRTRAATTSPRVKHPLWQVNKQPSAYSNVASLAYVSEDVHGVFCTP